MTTEEVREAFQADRDVYQAELASQLPPQDTSGIKTPWLVVDMGYLMGDAENIELSPMTAEEIRYVWFPRPNGRTLYFRIATEREVPGE